MNFFPVWLRILLGFFILLWQAPGHVNAWYENKWNDMARPYKDLRAEQFKAVDTRLDSIDRKLDILIQRQK